MSIPDNVRRLSCGSEEGLKVICEMQALTAILRKCSFFVLFCEESR